MTPARRSRLLGTFMMISSILVVCLIVPLAFILGGQFSHWLEQAGVHAAPNISGGTPIAGFARFDRQILETVQGFAAAEVERALAIRDFWVKKVAFRPLSGMGIAPRLNLLFEFDGQLPDPLGSASKFSATTIHVYVKSPGKPSAPINSDKVAHVKFEGGAWNYQVIIDGFHDQARIFDEKGNLVARGLGLYVDYVSATGQNDADSRRIVQTQLTAALPIDVLGDPAEGLWEYYVLVGLADSRNPSMMLHSPRDGRLRAYSRAVSEARASGTVESNDHLNLPALLVSNPR